MYLTILTPTFNVQRWGRAISRVYSFMKLKLPFVPLYQKFLPFAGKAMIGKAMIGKAMIVIYNGVCLNLIYLHTCRSCRFDRVQGWQ